MAETIAPSPDRQLTFEVAAAQYLRHLEDGRGRLRVRDSHPRTWVAAPLPVCAIAVILKLVSSERNDHVDVDERRARCGD